ncbi:MAG TPA: hypothetical protein ENI05_01105 [Porticoccus sp.]|nr:hypothetical protein [Porticoccus sp.]
MNKTDNNWSEVSVSSRNSVRKWTATWVVSFALASFGPRVFWDYEPLISIGFVLLSLALGAGMVLANGRYLRQMDELQRQIFLEAGALSLGIGMVVGCTYEILEDIHLITFEPEISHLVIVMCLSFGMGLIKGNRKYQ